MLVRERAFWTCFSKRFCSRLASFAETLSLLPGTPWALTAETASLRSASDRCAYQTSSVFMVENPCIASR